MKSKLVTCKSCGTDIAKTASRCPKCGAKQHQAALIACVLIIFFTVILCAVVLMQPNKGPGSGSTQEPPVQISAIDLRKAYDENVVNADALYKDHVISVTGTIADITQDVITKNPCVSLSSEDSLGIYTVQCFFDESDEMTGKIASLKDGDSVTIVGRCSGRPLANVQLINCSLGN